MRGRLVAIFYQQKKNNGYPSSLFLSLPTGFLAINHTPLSDLAADSRRERQGRPQREKPGAGIGWICCRQGHKHIRRRTMMASSGLWSASPSSKIPLQHLSFFFAYSGFLRIADGWKQGFLGRRIRFPSQVKTWSQAFFPLQRGFFLLRGFFLSSVC